jgi:hypothetical protein
MLYLIIIMSCKLCLREIYLIRKNAEYSLNLRLFCQIGKRFWSNNFFLSESELKRVCQVAKNILPNNWKYCIIDKSVIWQRILNNRDKSTHHDNGNINSLHNL